MLLLRPNLLKSCGSHPDSRGEMKTDQSEEVLGYVSEPVQGCSNAGEENSLRLCAWCGSLSPASSLCSHVAPPGLGG